MASASRPRHETMARPHLGQNTGPEERNDGEDGDHSHISHPSFKLFLDTPHANGDGRDEEHVPMRPGQRVRVLPHSGDREVMFPAVADVKV